MSSGCIGSENIPNLCCNNWTTDIVKSVRVALHIYTHDVIVFITKKKKKKNLQRFFHCAEEKIKGSYNWKRPTVKNDLDKFEGEDFEFKVIIQIKTELQYSHLSRKNFNLINIQYFVYCEKRFLRVNKRNWTSLLNQTIRCSENGIFGVNSRNKDNP